MAIVLHNNELTRLLSELTTKAVCCPWHPFCWLHQFIGREQ